MTTPIVKTAIESDEASVIDSLKVAFVADPASVGYGQIRRNILRISLDSPRLLEEKRLNARVPTTLETILVQHFGSHQTLTLM